MLLGKDPRQIERHWDTPLREERRAMGRHGVEMRAISAIDAALWDILGQSLGAPIWQLLGGLAHDRVPTYNTCGGPMYGRNQNRGGDGKGPLEDLWAQLNEPEVLAQELLDEGIRAMKIWPLDRIALRGTGRHITAAELREGLEPFKRIREAVGDQIEIMLEGHGYWDITTAKKIAHAVEEYRPAWLEDMVLGHDVDQLKELKDSTTTPILASELLITRYQYRPLMEKRAADIVMIDPTWAGGITESRKIATMAESFGLPVALHDCTGPFTLMAGVQLAFSAPNAIYQETVRAYMRTWYRDFVTELGRGRGRPRAAADGSGHRHEPAAGRAQAPRRARPDHLGLRPGGAWLANRPVFLVGGFKHELNSFAHGHLLARRHRALRLLRRGRGDLRRATGRPPRAGGRARRRGRGGPRAHPDRPLLGGERRRPDRALGLRAGAVADPRRGARAPRSAGRRDAAAPRGDRDDRGGGPRGRPPRAAARDRRARTMPIAATFDTHVHGTARMARFADALVGFKTHPHVDHYDAARLAMSILVRAVRGEVRPITVHRKLRMLTSAEKQNNQVPGAYRDLIAVSREMETRPGVLAVSIFTTQPWMDLPEVGWSIEVVTDGDRALGEAIADELGRMCWDRREEFLVPRTLDRRGARPCGRGHRAADRVRRRLRFDDRRWRGRRDASCWPP